MSACWAEDFERYPSASLGEGPASMLQGAWASIDISNGFHGYDISSARPRTGTKSFAFVGTTGTSQFARRILGGPKTGAGLEYGLWISNLPSGDGGSPAYNNSCSLGQFLDASGALQAWATIGSDGSVLIIDVAHGGVKARGRPIIPAASYVQIGVKCGLVDAVNGLMEVRVNNVVACSAILNTDPTGAHEISQVRFQWASAEFSGVSAAYFDDMHAWDTTPGNGPSDFVGNAAIVRRVLTADTARADMTVVGGPNGHTVLSDADDATFIEAANIGQRSEFTGAALPSEVTGVIYQQVTFRAAKSNIGDCNTVPYVATPGSSPETVEIGAEAVMSAADQWYWGIFATEPTTGMPFTPAQILADRIGFERTL